MPDGDLLQYLQKIPGANRAEIVRVRVVHRSEYTEFDTQDDWNRRGAFLSPPQRCYSRRLEGGEALRLGRFRLLTVARQENILFDSAGIPRIADFGISSTSNPISNNASTPYHGYSIRWAAPEILVAPNDESRRPTKMSGVYAFGMVVVEVRCHHDSRRLAP
jgi:hypothetical protein